MGPSGIILHSYSLLAQMFEVLWRISHLYA